LPRRAALALAEKGLIGQFTGLWPSPKIVQKVGGKELDRQNTRENLYQILLKGIFYISF